MIPAAKSALPLAEVRFQKRPVPLGEVGDVAWVWPQPYEIVNRSREGPGDIRVFDGHRTPVAERDQHGSERVRSSTRIEQRMRSLRRNRHARLSPNTRFALPK